MRNPFATRRPAPPILGFHGKAPVYGDFVSRGLPPPVLAAWDAVLQTLVLDGRAAHGDTWLDAWLQAPVWHIDIGENMLASVPLRAVLIPSVDRARRYFPFTILAQAAPAGCGVADWRHAAEELALTALEDNFAVETLEAGLRTLGFPSDAAIGPGTVWWRRHEGVVPEIEIVCVGWPDGARLIAGSG